MGGEITDHGICQFRAGPGASLERLKRAVSSWIQETEEGKEAWEQSGNDLNIGDLVCCYQSGMLLPYGIEALNVSVGEDVVTTYDTILGYLDSADMKALEASTLTDE